MSTRAMTEQDILTAFKLKGVVDSKIAATRAVDLDAAAKRKTAENVYQSSVTEANDIRDKAVAAAAAKRDKAVAAQDTRVTKANDEITAAQQALDEFQAEVDKATGARVPLPGAASASGVVRV